MSSITETQVCNSNDTQKLSVISDALGDTSETNSKDEMLLEIGEDVACNEEVACNLVTAPESAVNGAEHWGDETDDAVFKSPSADNEENVCLRSPIKRTQQSTKRLSSVVDVDHLARCQRSTEDVPEVKSFTIALLELAFEKQVDISSAAITTVQQLGRKHPSTVLRTLHSYISASNGKASTRVLATILTIMETTINPAIEAEHLDNNLATSLIKLALNEMVNNQESLPDIQIPASNILVSIGAVYCRDVIEMLCSRLELNIMPHPSVLVSLATLATVNIYGTVPHLKSVLDTLVALLSTGQVKSNALRCGFATAFAKFSEAILFYLANMERAPNMGVQREWFSEGMAEAFEVLFLQWLPCKITLTCQEILEALGQMSQLLAKEQLERMAQKLLSSLIQNYKGPVEPLYVSRCLALILDAFFSNGSVLPDIAVQEILNSLFLQMTIQPDYSQPSTVKNHYEVCTSFWKSVILTNCNNP